MLVHLEDQGCQVVPETRDRKEQWDNAAQKAYVATMGKMDQEGKLESQERPDHLDPPVQKGNLEEEARMECLEKLELLGLRVTKDPVGQWVRLDRLEL